MRAARLHKVGAPFQIDEIPSPKLPAIFGLDAASVVERDGSNVHGDRVYVNPGLSCGSCVACRWRDNTYCPAYAFQGYFGFGTGAQQLYEDYPYGGFSESVTAPTANLVKLPEAVTFEQGTRLGYVGTAYAGIRKAGLEVSQTLIINGATGALGLGGTLCALAIGAKTIFASGRNQELLAQLKELVPTRIRPIVLGERSVLRRRDAGDRWLRRRRRTSGAWSEGACFERAGLVCDAAPRWEGSRSGRVSDPIPLEPFPLVCQQKSLIGSLWFTPAEGENMATMGETGARDLSVFEHQVPPLEKINEAPDAVSHRRGGFTNVVINPASV